MKYKFGKSHLKFQISKCDNFPHTTCDAWLQNKWSVINMDFFPVVVQMDLCRMFGLRYSSVNPVSSALSFPSYLGYTFIVFLFCFFLYRSRCCDIH